MPLPLLPLRSWLNLPMHHLSATIADVAADDELVAHFVGSVVSAVVVVIGEDLVGHVRYCVGGRFVRRVLRIGVGRAGFDVGDRSAVAHTVVAGFVVSKLS